MGKLSINQSQKVKEAEGLLQTHTEWLAYKEWDDIVDSLSGLVISPEEYDKIYDHWKSWQTEKKRLRLPNRP